MATVTSPRRTIDRTDTDRRVRHPLQALRRGYIRRYVTLEGAAVAVIYLAPVVLDRAGPRLWRVQAHAGL